MSRRRGTKKEIYVPRFVAYNNNNKKESEGWVRYEDDGYGCGCGVLELVVGTVINVN